jgi:hypothetical protein
MNPRKFVLNLMLLFVLFLAACGGAPTEAMEKSEEDTMMAESTEDAMMDDKPTEEAMMPHDTPTPDAMAEPAEETMMEMPAWFGASLKDVRSGASFTINDFQGKVVLVETMAVWCPTCFRQQQEIKALHELLGMREAMKMKRPWQAIYSRTVSSTGIML